MELTDLLLVATRWLHALAAVAWIGAVLYELLVLRPALGELADARLESALDSAAREIVQTSLLVFLISGAILTFERLSRGAAGGPYVALLGAKILLSVAAFQLQFRLRRTVGPGRLAGLRLLAVLGLTIIFLASLLKSIYERALLT